MFVYGMSCLVVVSLGSVMILFLFQKRKGSKKYCNGRDESSKIEITMILIIYPYLSHTHTNKSTYSYTCIKTHKWHYTYKLTHLSLSHTHTHTKSTYSYIHMYKDTQVTLYIQTHPSFSISHTHTHKKHILLHTFKDTQVTLYTVIEVYCQKKNIYFGPFFHIFIKQKVCIYSWDWNILCQISKSKKKLFFRLSF